MLLAANFQICAFYGFDISGCAKLSQYQRYYQNREFLTLILPFHWLVAQRSVITVNIFLVMVLELN